ncbi:hypothetical protein Acy02nite_56160 [Actinoplanes cyaneus]|uniref:Uncharacterized protein n=1 Tax=Actinoplanes cyaneus TaxID=52696 RepID=A0A919ITG5_9ACTN|nr:hypothetical protein Acy02nite_56160 [Actinoplanes cyaneus]
MTALISARSRGRTTGSNPASSMDTYALTLGIARMRSDFGFVTEFERHRLGDPVGGKSGCLEARM